MNPAKLQRLVQEGIGHHRAGRFAQAEAIYRQARTAAPKDVDANHLGGLVAYQQGRHADALELLTRASRLNPKDEICAMRLALALIANSRPADAEKLLRGIVQRSPAIGDAWENLAFCLKIQDKLEDAVLAHQKALALKPQNATGWYNFGLTYSLMGRISEALACHERALAVDPKLALGHYGKAQALYQSNRVDESVAEYDTYLKAEPGNLEAHSYRLFALNYSDSISREALFDAHRAYNTAVGKFPKPLFPNAKDPNKKLRIGVLSPDLRAHSCAYFLEPLVRSLDKTQFEWVLYCDHFREDEVSARLKTQAVIWRNFVGQGSDAVEAAIRADQPDILIDLAGHTGMTNRLPVFARHLAPLQITYLGYPNTTGLDAMDYRLTDAICDPAPEADRFASEKLLRFSSTAWAYDPSPLAQPVSPLPCLSGEPFTFGCFNNLGKITDTALRLWGRVLTAVPGSRLLLKGRDLTDPVVRQRYVARLAAANVPIERVQLLERTATPKEHLALYDRIDVSLDSYPYHGTTTTCEALWQGVPVITLVGDRHVSRVSASLVNAVGHPEWAAQSEADYVRIAAALAADRPKLSEIRELLRPKMAVSPILDHAGQASRLASSLRAVWAGWCAGE